MYYIMTDTLYWHSKGRVILFDTIEECQGFAQQFFNYATGKMVMEQGPISITSVLQAQTATKIEEARGDESFTSITWAELEKERAATSRSN